MPLPLLPIASTVRIYRLRAGHRPSEPQGGRDHGLASRPELWREATALWMAEEARLSAEAVAPVTVIRSQVGLDLFIVSVLHPQAGLLRMTIIAVEPA